MVWRTILTPTRTSDFRLWSGTFVLLGIVGEEGISRVPDSIRFGMGDGFELVVFCKRCSFTALYYCLVTFRDSPGQVPHFGWPRVPDGEQLGDLSCSDQEIPSRPVDVIVRLGRILT